MVQKLTERPVLAVIGIVAVIVAITTFVRTASPQAVAQVSHETSKGSDPEITKLKDRIGDLEQQLLVPRQQDNFLERVKKILTDHDAKIAKEQEQHFERLKKALADFDAKASKDANDLFSKLSRLQNPIRYGYFEEVFGSNGAGGTPVGKGQHFQVFSQPLGGKKVIAVWHEVRGCPGSLQHYGHIMAEPDGDRIRVLFDFPSDIQTLIRIRFHYLYVD